MQFKMYVTDSLFYAPQRKRLTKRFSDIINPQKVDNRSAKDIVDDITKRAEITLK